MANHARSIQGSGMFHYPTGIPGTALRFVKYTRRNYEIYHRISPPRPKNTMSTQPTEATKDPRKFAQHLEIPDLDTHARRFGIQPVRLMRAAPTVEADPKPSAKLIKGQVTAFTAGMTGQDKQDVEYITLAAQLNSDIKVPNNQSFEGTKAWFENYRTVMSNLGWIMSFDWEKYEAASQGLTMDKVVLEILSAIASENGIAIAKAAIDAVESLKADDDRLKLFSNSTTSDEAGKFLLGLASKQDESISMAFGAFAMDFKTRDTSVLWFHWKSSDLKIYRDQKVATFNQHAYAAKAREVLEEKMQGHVETYAEDLDIGF